MFCLATILSDTIALGPEVTVVISCDSALSKINICLTICPGNLYCLFLCVCVLLCVCSQSFLYLAWYMAMSVLGHYNNFFFAVHLLDIAMGFKTLRTILSSVTHNGKQVCVVLSCVSPLHPSVLMCVRSIRLHARDVCFHGVGLYGGFSKMKKRIKAHLPLFCNYGMFMSVSWS